MKKRIGKWVVPCLLLTASLYLIFFQGCSGGGGGNSSSTPAASPSPSPPTVPTQEKISLFSVSPTYETAFTANSTPVAISGTSSGPVASIQWKNVTTGETGAASGTETWSVQVPLQAGDNQVQILASSAAGAQAVTMPLTVTYNTSVTFSSLPDLSPDAGYVAETYDTIYVRVAIEENNLDPSSVKIYKVDSARNKIQLLGTLADDGNAGNGDEIQGDGIYSAKISLSSAAADFIPLRIFASDKDNKPSMTSVFYFVFLEKPSDADLSRQEATNNLAAGKYEELIQQKRSTGLSERDAGLQSLASLAAYVAGLDGVLLVQKGDFSVWWMDQSGMVYVIEAPFGPDDLSSPERGGVAPVEDAGIDWDRFNASRTQVQYLRRELDAAQPNAPGIFWDVDEKLKVGSLDAIYVSPYADLSAKGTAASGWTKVLKDCECLNKKQAYIHTGADPYMHTLGQPYPDFLNAWKELNKYGLISTLTHGMTAPRMKEKLQTMAEKWAEGKLPEYRAKYPDRSDAELRDRLKAYFLKRVVMIHSWNGDDREYFASNVGMGGSKEAQKSYLQDPQYESLRAAIHQNRIILVIKRNPADKSLFYNLGITPEFISYHNKGNFPKSIWFATACFSYSTGSMANMFISKGGLTYVGFSNVTSLSYGVNTNSAFFDALVNQGKTAKESIDAARAAHGTNDGDATPSYISGKGEGQARVVFELKNANFEEPGGKGSLEGWQTEGDARAVKKLGGASPIEGATMGIISSGLGLTTSYGKLSQTLCLGPKVKDLIFDWNFFSEEFKEYCHRGFDDTFIASVTDKKTGVEKAIFRTSVDTLCGACNGNDLTSAACTSLPLAKSSVGFDKGDVWETGWKADETVSLRDFAGKSVVLKFYLEDKGDTIYDTAVLIDKVRITTD